MSLYAVSFFFWAAHRNWYDMNDTYTNDMNDTYTKNNQKDRSCNAQQDAFRSQRI